MKHLLTTFSLIVMVGCVQQPLLNNQPLEQDLESGFYAQKLFKDKGLEQNIPQIKIRVTTDKTTFKLGEDVTIMIMMQKTVDRKISARAAYFAAEVKVDKKVFTKPKTNILCFSGPVSVSKEFEIGFGLTLAEYGINRETLSTGSHQISVRIGADVSNTLTINIIN